MKPLRSNPLIFLKHMRSTSIALLAIWGLSACETTTSGGKYRIEVKDSLDTATPLKPTSKYVVIYDGNQAADLIKPHAAQLGAAFAQLGYKPGNVSDSDIIINVSLDMDAVVTKNIKIDVRNLPGATNLDSPRYQNLANQQGTQLGPGAGLGGMVLDANERDPTNTIITAEQLATGGADITEYETREDGVGEPPVKKTEILDQPVEAALPNTVPLDYQISLLIINVLESPDFQDENSFSLKWQLRVESMVPQDRERPEAKDLVDAAVNHLAKRQSQAEGN